MSFRQHTFGNNEPTGTKRKRGNFNSVEEELAWTATRCQRLLRTITSRISALRKFLESPDGGHSRISNDAFKKPQPRKTEHWSSVDPAWLPTGKPKVKGRTYAAKPKDGRRKPLNARDPNFAFPSPFVKRIGTSGGNFKVQDEPEECDARPEKKSRRSRQLPIKPRSERQEVEAGLVLAVSNLLSTTKATQPQRHGSRSLLSTCLRQVPGFVDFSVEEQDENVDEDEVLGEVFTYLEDLGAGEGWMGLRDVVRKQCIHLAAEAIDDNLLSEKTVSSLIDICSSQGAVAEGQDLLQAWLKRPDAASATSLDRLDAFTSRHQCHEFKFRALNNLGQSQTSNLIRIESSPTFWKDLLSSLTSDWGNATMQCLVSCVATFADLEAGGELKAGIRANMRDLALKVTVMATASLLANESLATSSPLSECVLRVAADTALRAIKNSERHNGRIQPLSEFETLFLLGSQLLLGLKRNSQLSCGVFDLDTLTGLLQLHGDRTNGRKRESTLRMRLEDFASEITKGIITLEKFVGVTVTGKLLDQALDAIENGSSAAALLKQVALETTSVLRQAEDGSANLDLEEYLKRLNDSPKQTNIIQTPHQGTKTGKFRWEEGLCEWVTATPFINRADAEEEAEPVSNVDESEQTSPSNECSPDVLALSPPLKRRRVQATSPLWNKKVTKGVVVVPFQRPVRGVPIQRVDTEEDESGDELCF